MARYLNKLSRCGSLSTPNRCAGARRRRLCPKIATFNLVHLKKEKKEKKREEKGTNHQQQPEYRIAVASSSISPPRPRRGI
jgi:hypothetical protein